MEQFKKKTLYVAFITSAAISFAFIYYMYIDPVQTGVFMWILESNVKIYAVFLIIFFALFFIINFLGNFLSRNKIFREKDAGVLSKTTQILTIILITSIGFGLFVHWGLVAQFKEVGVANGTYYDFPMAFQVILMLLIFFWMAWMVIKDRDIESVSMWVAYTVSILVTFMCLFIANPFSCVNSALDFQMSLWDNTSVTETIYNVFDGVPYTYATTGLYGHYPLFFSLPLKFSGGGYSANYRTDSSLWLSGTSGCYLCH